MKPTVPPKPGSARDFRVLALVCLAATWSLVALVNGLLVHNAAEEAREAARNTAAMSAAYVRQSLDAGRLVLHGMQALLIEKGVQDEAGYRAFLEGPTATQVLRDRIANLEEIDKAAFIAPTGEILNFSVVYPPPPINVADRDYFREQMGDAPPVRSLSAAMLDRSSGKWTFFLAQRVERGAVRAALLAQDRGAGEALQGRPFGLAIVGFRAHLVSDFLGHNRLGAGRAVVLLRDDNVVLAGAGVPPAAYGQELRLDGQTLLASEPVAGFPARIAVLGGPVDRMKVLRLALPASLALGALASFAILFALWRTRRGA